MAGSNPSRELILRTLSGAVIVLGIIGGIYLGGTAWLCVVATLALISQGEYYRLLGKRLRLSRGIGYICSLAVLLSAVEGSRPVSIALILSLSTYAIFMVEILRRQTTGQSFVVGNVGGTMSGVLFIVMPWTCILLLRSLPTGNLVLVSLFASTWGCDVMAYLIGARWGRNRLCEHVSPKKTWEGFIGGFLGSFLMAAIVIYVLEQPPYPLFLIGLVCGLAGQMGDLAESLLKRELDEKDSGRLIPGHGGVLDRFDSILINGLLTYLLFGIVLV